MKKLPVFIFCLLGVILAFAKISRAQITEPPVDLPFYSPTPTAGTSLSLEKSDGSYYSYVTLTPSSGGTAPVYSEEYTDDADTGTELYVVAGLSLVAGLGLYFIKRYFDLKKYSL